MSNVYFIGVDVGTGSARAALITENGKILKTAVETIQTWNPQPDFYEQSSDNIWTACVKCIKSVTAGINPENVKGMGFDATCSLVAVDISGNPVSLSPTGNSNQNVILWMDHRASQQAERINQLKHDVLKFVGGKISLEMQTPKLAWIKANLPLQWAKTERFFDLPDFLTWKATGEDSRSLCSLVCKWTYEINGEGEGSWNSNYFEQIGLGDLKNDNWAKIGSKVLPPGSPVGQGLCAAAAKELGLKLGTPVGTSIIDAHAGGLGLVGCHVPETDSNFNTRLSLICGTSTCHMAVSQEPHFVKGVWGPYYSAMVPGMWLNEGGQSATGALIDHVINLHPSADLIKAKLGNNVHIQSYLSQLLKTMAKKRNLTSEAFLTRDLHVWPDFHGNRSPIADATLTGMVCGLTLSEDEESLAVLYLATVQALAYGTRHILEKLTESGHSIKSILICGGLSKNLLFTQTQADVVNLPVISPEETEAVLLGSAILGACAAGYFPYMTTAIKSMGGKGTIVRPDQSVIDYHDRKYRVFLEMHKAQQCFKNIMMK